MSKKSTVRRDSSDRGVETQQRRETENNPRIEETAKYAYAGKKLGEEPEPHSLDQKHKEK